MEFKHGAGDEMLEERKAKYKGKHDKPKPWDDESIDHWKIDKFDPSWNEQGILEVSSFSTLFPQYREKYLQEAWPMIKSALKEYGISCELNLLLKDFPKDLVSLKRAQVLFFYMGHPDLSLNLVEQILPENEEESYTYGMLAFSYLELGRIVDAEKAARKEFQINKQDF